MDREIEFRAWCEGIEFALEDIIKKLPVGTELSALKWGPSVIPLDITHTSDVAMDTVRAVTAAVTAVWGKNPNCLPGRGTLYIRETASTA